MRKMAIDRIRKRDGSIAVFEPIKISRAIQKALIATNSEDGEVATRLTERVVAVLEDQFAPSIPSVEDVQDVVETVLMTQGYPAAAKAYILYRQQRADVRRLKGVIGVQDDLKLSVNAVK